MSDRSQPRGPAELLKPGPAGSTAHVPTDTQLWSRLSVKHVHRNMRPVSLMEMHRPLMLLPPVSVTLHSLCTLDESCGEDGTFSGLTWNFGSGTERQKGDFFFPRVKNKSQNF